MKKSTIWAYSIIGALAIGVVALLLINNHNEPTTITKSDAQLFKEEYERLNGQKINNSEYTHKTLNIPESNPIVYSNYQEIFSLLENGTGVIYFGFPECPWCRNALSPLLDTAKASGIDKVYYLNNSADRDNKILENSTITTEQEGSEDYYKLLRLLGDSASAYAGLNDQSVKRLYFPTVVFINKGKIIDTHVATVDSQENPYIELTNAQEAELKQLYQENFNKITLCDEAC